jgi:predicted acyl esterase
VQVQSSWFPLYDRNPQKFIPNIFEAKESDYQKATQHIYRSRKFPSSVEIMTLPQGTVSARN